MRLQKHKILDINFIRARNKIDEEKHKAELLGLKLAEKEQKNDIASTNNHQDMRRSTCRRPDCRRHTFCLAAAVPAQA